jgi:galactitol PTS system EIIA component
LPPKEGGKLPEKNDQMKGESRMEEMLTMIREKLVLINIEAKTNLQAIELVANHLNKEGYVTDDYKEAVINREKVYPTGLQTLSEGIAIPHADPQYVINEAIAIATLATPVPFKRMELPESDLDVEIIFMLAINNPMKQVKTLQELTKIIQDKDILERLRKAKDSTNLMASLKEFSLKS